MKSPKVTKLDKRIYKIETEDDILYMTEKEIRDKIEDVLAVYEFWDAVDREVVRIFDIQYTRGEL